MQPTPAGAANRTRLLIAGLIAVVGAVWALQGVGVPIGGSFMVGDPTWTLIGAGLIVGAIAYAAWPRLRRR